MGKFSEYKLPLKSLSEGTHEFEYKLGKQFFADMENTDVRDAALTVHLTVTHRHDAYDLVFKLSGTVTLLCDRCLDDLEIPIDTEYRLMVKYGEDYNDESDDLLIIPQSDNYLNVSYMIYDTAVLAIPIKHVHPLGKCNRQMSALLKRHRAGGGEDAELQDSLLEGIDDDDAGSEAPADPRWDALRGLAGEDKD